MRTLSREEVLAVESYTEILEAESHHNHEMIEDDHGVWRWKRNERVDALVDKLGLNELWMLFHSMGLGKNSESVRKLYRDMGYSLSGYYDVFYWDVNNEEVAEYKGGTKE